MKKSQKKWVVEQIEKYGEISRNSCLQTNITRLSAIMLKLKREGWNFTTFSRGGDYVYSIGKPKEELKVEVKPLRFYTDPLTGEKVLV